MGQFAYHCEVHGITFRTMMCPACHEEMVASLPSQQQRVVKRAEPKSVRWSVLNNPDSWDEESDA